MRNGAATFEDRRWLADLYRLSDQLEPAEAIYRKLLEQDPRALHLWPGQIACLVGLGRGDEARRLRRVALRELKDSTLDMAWVRRQLEELEIR